ncbi:hypothetical protein ACHAXR_013218 [Thalassiosira sp. AJA248-18]
MAYYAFIVGVNQDWPEQRCSHGDIGLARCLSNQCHLPKENLAEVYDERATRSNILRSLENLMDRRNEQLARRKNHNSSAGSDGEQHHDEIDTLLFYYGGHGKHREFCTQTQSINNGAIQKEPWLKHSEIVDLLERKFNGGVAWCVIDCCHSGGFGEAVVQRYHRVKSLNVNYGCIMSVPPAAIAGLEWSMSECFIRAFKGELCCSRDERNCYYLSTKKGLHPIKPQSEPTPTTYSCDDDAPENKCNVHPTWEQVIDYLSDEMARIKGDRLTTLFWGDGMEDGKLLQKPCIFGDNIRSATSNTSLQIASIPRDETWMDRFRRECHAVNDGVCVKWVGRATTVEDGICPRIGWFPGRIISISMCNNNNSVHEGSAEGDEPPNLSTACIELYDVICKSHWTVTVRLSPSSSMGTNTILGGFHMIFGFGFVPQPCVTVITHMATQLAYFDTTLPPHIQVSALWDDGKWYSAKTLCRTEISWEQVDLESSLQMSGPCVPVRWDDDGSISFVPTSACIVKDTISSKKTLAEKSTRDATEAILTPVNAMLASLACEGKRLQGDTPISDGLVTEDSSFWEAYDAEDCKWVPVHLMNTVNISSIPLKVLASHMCYHESGKFSLVCWESDSTLALVPTSSLRQRPTADNDEDSSEEESSVETVDDHGDVKKYIDEICYDLDKNWEEEEDPVTPNQKQLLQLGAVLLFGIGLLRGSRSKR